MHDAGVGRHHLEIAERGLAPAQEHVALAVAAEFDLVVVLERVRGAVFVDLHRVIDHQLGGRERIHALRIAAERDDGLAHRREIDDARHAGEVLHDHARRREGDLVSAAAAFGSQREQRLDVALRDVDAVLEAQQILQQDLQRKRQAVDVVRFERARLQISYFCVPTSSVVLALKLSVMIPPAKKKNYKRALRVRRAARGCTAGECRSRDDAAAETQLVRDRIPHTARA